MRKTREVAIFVYRGDEFLIARRVPRGVWNVIAGQVEDGESFPAAAARELAEETGLVATPFDLGMAHRCQDLRASCRVWTACGSNVDELSRIRRVPTGGVYRMLIALDLRLRLAS